MLFAIFHCTLLLLLFLPFYVEMNRDDWDDEKTAARITRSSRQFFWLGVAACVIYDLCVWRSFATPAWLFVGFIGLFSLWRFGDCWWSFMRRRAPEKKDEP